jgi:hypothetical protein
LTRFPGTHGQFLGALGYRRAALRGAAVDAILSDDAELTTVEHPDPNRPLDDATLVAAIPGPLRGKLARGGSRLPARRGVLTESPKSVAARVRPNA